MNLFYYTEVKPEIVEVEGQEPTTINVPVTGYSFSLDDVILTYPDDDMLNIVLSIGADKLNPVDYQYKRDPKTGQKTPIKVSKFEITNEPVVVQLKVKEEINKFFEMTGGPTW